MIREIQAAFVLSFLCSPCLAEPISIGGNIVQGSIPGCWLVTDWTSHEIYELIDVPPELQRVYAFVQLTGYPQPEVESDCTEGTPFVIIGGELIGGGHWPPLRREVTPKRPSFHENITLTLADVWPDSCTPTGSHIRFDGTTIFFDVFRDRPSSAICFDMFTPWSMSHDLGALPPGTYTVITTLFAYENIRFWPMEVYTFTVESNPVQSFLIYLPDLMGLFENGIPVSTPIVLPGPLFDVRDVTMSVGGEVDLGTMSCESELYSWGGQLTFSVEPQTTAPVRVNFYSRYQSHPPPPEYFSRFERLQTLIVPAFADLEDGNASLAATFNQGLIDNKNDGGPWPPPCDVLESPLVELNSVTLRVRANLRYDFDRNRYLDLADFSAWPSCSLGPGVLSPKGCEIFDADRDGDIDLIDAEGFFSALVDTP